MNNSKRKKETSKLVDLTKQYSLDEAIALLKSCPKTKFDQSVDFSVYLGVDPKKADQLVRGTVGLPHGTGKKITIVVLTQGEKQKEAKEAGADFVGAQELVDKIKGGWTDFSVLVTTPDMMREVGKLGKILGPRGLMPTPKAGTVTTDVTKAVSELKRGKIEFKVDKNSVINRAVGKMSFSVEQIKENINAILSAIIQKKPSSAKGAYIKSVFISTTMGPGLKLDLQSVNI